MSFVKYATAEILDVKTSKTRLPFEYGSEPGSMFQKFAALENTGDTNGYLYIRTRAISSRVNKNNDGWPSGELAKGYKTFVGRPLFVDHNNDDPKRTRGVVLDARLFVDEGDEKTSALDPYYSSAPAAHLPPTHIETISEVDAQTFPVLAKALLDGKVNSVSMGANIETSVCSVCENSATTPKQYCAHIKSKGNEFEVTSADGSVSKRKAYEDCYGVNFFEQSFVFDPADETALFNGAPSDQKLKFANTQKTGFMDEQGNLKYCPECFSDDVIKDYEERGDWKCANCPGYGRDPSELLDEDEAFKLIKEDDDYRANPVVIGRRAKEAAEQLRPYDPAYDTYDPDPNLFAQNMKDYQGGDISPGDIIAAYPDGTIVLDDGITTWNMVRAQEYAKVHGWSKTAAGLKTDVNQPGDEAKTDGIKNKFPDGEKPSTKKPQSESVAAPERVDTLSNDLVCPNCESDDLQEDPDGIYRCPTCEYELPPEGFRSPDLEEAKEMDLKQKIDSEPNEEGDQETNTDAGLDDEGGDEVTFEDDKKKKNKLGPVAPVQPMSKTINNNKSNGIISEMNWETKTENVDFVVQYLSKVGNVQNLDNENTVARHLLESYGRERLSRAQLTRLEIAEGIEKFASLSEKVAASETVTLPKAGIHAGSVKIFKMLGLQGTATYHNAGPFAERFDELPDSVKVGLTKSGDDIICDLNQVNPPLTQGIGMACAEARGDEECEVTLEVTPDQALPYAVKLFEARGTGPVWSAVEQALEEGDGPKAMSLMAQASVKQPVKRKPINPRQPQSTKDEKIVSDQLKPVEADRRVIKREESDDGESGVKRTETIIEETGELGGSLSDEPKAEEESEEPKAESTQDTSSESTSQEPESSESSEEEESDNSWQKKKEPAYASVERESNLLLAMEVAKLASSLGVIPAREELSYAAELEQKSEDVIRDRLDTLSSLKTAGVLQKQARFTQVPQVPRLGKFNGNGTVEEKESVEEYLSEIFN